MNSQNIYLPDNLKMKTELTHEQSQRLFDVGVPKEAASIKEDIHGPALFTLTDLMKLLPTKLSNRDDTYLFKIEGDDNSEEYWVSYYHYKCFDGNVMPMCIYARAEEELIDALYCTVIWYYSKVWEN